MQEPPSDEAKDREAALERGGEGLTPSPDGSSFRTLWVASAASNIGDGISLTAAPLLAATLTRDPVLVAGLVVAQRIPWFLFSLPSGALVDRLDRRTVLISVNLFRAVAIGMLALAISTDRVVLPMLYGVFFLLGTSETLVDNAAVAILPSVVAPDKFATANGRLYATQTVANEFAGPPLGGFLFAVLHGLPFALNAGAYGVAGLALVRLRGRFRVEQVTGERASLVGDIWTGLHWFWQHRLLRALGLMAGVNNFFYAATSAVFVLVAQDILRLGNTGFGFVLAAGALGGVVGSLTAERIVAFLGTGRTIAVTTLLPGIAFAGIAMTSQPIIAGAMFVLMSFASMVGNVVLISLRQTIIPDHLLGRVTSAYRLFAIGAVPCGALFGGIVARNFGLTVPYWLGSITLVMLAVAILPIVDDRAIDRARQLTTSA